MPLRDVALRYFLSLALAAAVATWLLVAIGAFVRVTGSGLGCPDWPLCQGRLIPPPDVQAWTEYFHRLSAVVATVLMALTTLAAIRWQRDDPWVIRPALAVVPVVIVQIALGAVTVLFELPPEFVFVHFATAAVLLALLVVAAVSAGTREAREKRAGRSGEHPLLKPVALAALAAYGMILLGAYVLGAGASLACPVFPLCTERELLPSGNPGALVHMAHRVGALVLTALVARVVWLAFRLRGTTAGVRGLAVAAAVALAVQILAGVGMIIFVLPAALRLLHAAFGVGLWALLVALWVLTRHTLSAGERMTGSSAPRPVSEDDSPGRGQPSQAEAYLLLMKPGVLTLLLLTTLAAMLIGERGLPPWPLIVVTMLGGGLTAGGAAAFNHYLDRHVDVLMARTARRPIAAGLLTPREGLRFAVVASGAGLLILALGANLLAALLALLGLLHYVVIYSRLLKRFTPNNIVLGGAAGALAPLVGYAAVTNQLDLTAAYLFAIVFFWTPPHFWALALLVRGDYQRAQIPMLPVVYGDQETKRFILLYSVQLVAVTLLLVPARSMGWLYFGLALALGAVFVAYAVAMLGDDSRRGARRLFRYSILYLALLFAVMVLDRAAFAL